MPRASPLPPLDPQALERLALRYVERYATTRGKLTRYLARKIAERGWAEGAAAPDPPGLARRMAELRYVDDRGYAEAKAAAMARRGLGARRIAGALREAGIDAADSRELAPRIAARARSSALAFARKRRIGPFATAPADRAARERALAAMIRAGHAFDLARAIITLEPGDEPPCDESFDDCA